MPLTLSINYARAHVPFQWKPAIRDPTFEDLINEMKAPMHKGWHNMMDSDTLPAEEWPSEYDIFVPQEGSPVLSRVDDWTLDMKLSEKGIKGTTSVTWMPRWIPDRPKNCTPGTERVPCRMVCI